MPPTYTTPSGEIHLSKEAFNRLCKRCDGMFKSMSEKFERARNRRKKTYYDEMSFGSWNELVNSASKGDCHFCCSLVARALMSERSRLVIGEDVKLAEHSFPSLQPVVSQRGVLKTEIKPFINTSTPGGNKALILGRTYWFGRRFTFSLDIADENGERIKLANAYTSIHDDFDYQHDFPTSLDTGSEASLNQALQWVENCVSNHPPCNKVVFEKLQGRYPARLIDVGCAGSLTVRITETTGMDFQKQRYMTLSHCWGDAVPTRLLLDNYDSRLKGFALDELPKTFQDAILITRKLNVQFLWIDSLCIIQDSPEDWGAESAQMSFVYQNTYLNLAAGASPDSSGGFFLPRYLLSFVPWAMRLSEHSILIQQYEIERDSHILYTRGWVLQEQTLPRRTLISGRQELYWECSMVRASECFQDSIPWSCWSREFTPPLTKLFKRERLLDAERLEAWASLVDDYSGRKLTKQSDKLVAISGLAEQLSNRWNGVTYLAGLWSYCLRQSLLWTCQKAEQSKDTNIAPSWSWASSSAVCCLEVPGPWSEPRVDALANVLEVIVTPLTPTHLFGQVEGGTVRIKGPLLRATVRATTSELWWQFDLGEERAGMRPSPSDLTMQWDAKEPGDLAIIYLAPLQVQFRVLNPYSPPLFLQGLILRPALTSPVQKGKFERLGVFNMRQIMWDRKPLGEDEGSMFYTIDKLFPQLTGESEEERTSLLRSDPYLNGPLNTKLKHRYSPELEPEEYPILGNFLEYLELAAQHNRESDNPDKNLGQDEGNGYYIYELV